MRHPSPRIGCSGWTYDDWNDVKSAAPQDADKLIALISRRRQDSGIDLS